jgi:hypothetical protein
MHEPDLAAFERTDPTIPNTAQQTSFDDGKMRENESIFETSPVSFWLESVSEDDRQHSMTMNLAVEVNLASFGPKWAVNFAPVEVTDWI